MLGFTTLSTLYNINKIYYIIDEIYKINESNPDELEVKLEELKSRIMLNGCIGIKFTQWFITKIKVFDDDLNKRISKYFDDVFDNCPEHSIEYTQELFKKEFNMDINDFLEDIVLIGSGSIGQVYKGKIRGTDKVVAIKVKHPNVDNEINTIEPIVNILEALQSFTYLRNRYKLYINFREFLDDLKLQADFTNEVFNSIRFSHFYRNNSHIIIPKIFYYTKSIVISECISGVRYNELSTYGKSQACLNLIAFFEDSLLINNFIHCDLHEKNWSVLVEDNQYKLIIYDYGICYRPTSKDLANKLWIAFENNDVSTITEIARNDLITNCTAEVAVDIENAIQSISETHVSSYNILSKIVNILSRKENVIINKLIINLIIYFSMIENVLVENNVASNINQLGVNPEIMMYDTKMNMLSYSRAHSIYPELCKYITDTIKIPDGHGLFGDIEHSPLIFQPI